MGDPSWIRQYWSARSGLISPTDSDRDGLDLAIEQADLFVRHIGTFEQRHSFVVA
jgi:hypothetical protein